VPAKVDNRYQWTLKGAGFDAEFRALVGAAAKRQGAGVYDWCLAVLREAAQRTLKGGTPAGTPAGTPDGPIAGLPARPEDLVAPVREDVAGLRAEMLAELRALRGEQAASRFAGLHMARRVRRQRQRR
jgi:hypothetical protein